MNNEGFPMMGLDRKRFRGARVIPYECPNSFLPDFKLSEEEIDSLRVFQTDGNPLDKMRDIAWDLANNVTRMVGREDFILAFDLIAHSPLFISEDQKRGWLEGLVIGDSECGKTRSFSSLCGHYDLPELYTYTAGENRGGNWKTVFLGDQRLVGGEWKQMWGIMPQNDKRMLVVDGIGLSRRRPHPLEVLREPRTQNGMVSIRRIEMQRAWARTRLLWIVSTKGHRRLQRLSNAWSTRWILKAAVPFEEDLEPFDFILLASKDDVPESEIRGRKSTTSHIFTSDLCSLLLTWTWTRTFKQIKFENMSEDGKVNRVAAAIAARLFSTLDGVHLIIKNEHLSAARELLDRWNLALFMDSKYDDKRKANDTILRPEEIRDLMDAIAPLGLDFVPKLIRVKRFCKRTFADMAGIPGREAGRILRILDANGGVERGSSTTAPFRLTPIFAKILRKSEVEL